MERKFSVRNFENFGTSHKFVPFSGYYGQCCCIRHWKFSKTESGIFHGMESALVIGQIRIQVREVLLYFSSFREAANTSREAASFSFSLLRDSCSPLRFSLAAVSCGEESRKTSGTRVTNSIFQCCLLCFLIRCNQADDFEPAKILMNMCFTFFLEVNKGLFCFRHLLSQ